MSKPTILRKDYVITQYTESGLETTVFKTKTNALTHIENIKCYFPADDFKDPSLALTKYVYFSDNTVYKGEIPIN